jgi:hypothetical protein
MSCSFSLRVKNAAGLPLCGGCAAAAMGIFWKGIFDERDKL